MVKWIIQVFLIGCAVYIAYKNRYRLLSVLLSSGWIRRLLVSRTLDLPMIRDGMMNRMFRSSEI